MSNKQKTPVEILAEKTGKSIKTIYYHAKKLGRLPTEEELLKVKRGRKIKYEEKEPQ